MKQYLSYSEKLEDEQWLKKKAEINKRDNYKCRLCGKSKKLNVHHRYYIYNADPWQYPESALITLCESCHQLVHSTIPPLMYAHNKGNLVRMMFTPCKRCNGYGWFSEYKHIQNGLCFRCKGEKYEELIHHNTKLNSHVDKSADVFDDLMINKDSEKFFIRGNQLYKENLRKAKRLYFKAAISNFGKAQNNLGLILQEEGDIESAKRWFLYAAMQGVSEGIRNLGLLLKEEKNGKIFRKWIPILRKDDKFVCGIAFENFSKYIYNDDDKPSMEVFLLSIDKLVNLSKRGVTLAKEIVKEYKIEDIQKELLEHFKQLKK